MGYYAFYSTHFYDDFIIVVRYYDYYNDFSDVKDADEIRHVLSMLHDSRYNPDWENTGFHGDLGSDVALQKCKRTPHDLADAIIELQGHRYDGCEVIYHTTKYDQLLHKIASRVDEVIYNCDVCNRDDQVDVVDYFNK